MQTQVIPYLREIAKGDFNPAREGGSGRTVEVSLLTFEQALDSRDKTELEEIKTRLAADGINWHSLRYHKRPSVPATAFDILNGARFVRSLLQSEKFDVLHARSHVSMLMASLARRWAGLKPKIIFDIRGFFPEEYTDAGLWPEGGRLYRSAKRVERWLMKEADGFVVLTEKAKTILFPNEKSAGPVVEVIPCCVDLNRFSSATSGSREVVRKELGIGERKVLTYVGAFGGWYLTDEMVELFGVFKEIEPEGFAMILTQSKPETVEAKLREAGFGHGDLLIRKVPSSEIPKYLSAADVAVSFIKNCYSKQASSPTKNAEYLACGLPIIANAGIGDVDEQILSNRVGVIVDKLDREGYLSAFSEIAALGDISGRCRDTAEREFDLETVGGARYRRLYARLLGRKPPIT